MPANINKLKTITFELDSETSFNCQIRSWQIVNNTEDGERIFTFCPDGETREEPDDDYALELTFFSDWKTNGISEFFWLNDGATVDFTLDHYPDDPDQHVQWTGKVRVKAVGAGGEARANEEHSVTLPIKGKPTFVENASVEGSSSAA